MNKFENLNQYVFSDRAINHIVDTVPLTITLDFVGYIFNLLPRFNVGIFLYLNGKFDLFQLDLRHYLTQRKRRKILNFMYRNNIIKDRGFEPFPQYELHNNIPYKTENLNFQMEHLFL